MLAAFAFRFRALPRGFLTAFGQIHLIPRVYFCIYLLFNFASGQAIQILSLSIVLSLPLHPSSPSISFSRDRRRYLPIRGPRRLSDGFPWHPNRIQNVWHRNRASGTSCMLTHYRPFYSERRASANPKSSRQQFSACGACRMRR